MTPGLDCTKQAAWIEGEPQAWAPQTCLQERICNCLMAKGAHQLPKDDPQAPQVHLQADCLSCWDATLRLAVGKGQEQSQCSIEQRVDLYRDCVTRLEAQSSSQDSCMHTAPSPHGAWQGRNGQKCTSQALLSWRSCASCASPPSWRQPDRQIHLWAASMQHCLPPQACSTVHCLESAWRGSWVRGWGFNWERGQARTLWSHFSPRMASGAA